MDLSDQPKMVRFKKIDFVTPLDQIGGFLKKGLAQDGEIER